MIINPIKAIIMMDIKEMSSILCGFSGFVRESRREENPYNKPVRINGISMVLFTMKLCLTNRRFAIRILDPK